MKPYGQFCPVAKAAELFCERWTALIIRDLAYGATRFSELQRGVPLMSPTLLSKRLKDLEAEDIIEKQKLETGRGYSYHLTEAGHEFVPMILALAEWGQRWSRRELREHEIDLGLLIWAIERAAKADALGPFDSKRKQTVVHLILSDQPQNKRLWWFLNTVEGCQLCVSDPGFEVDLYVTCTLPDIIYVIRGDLTLESALASDRLEVIGHQRMRARLKDWLNLSPIVDIKSQRRAA